MESGDFFKLDKAYYKAIEAHPCGDPRDMSFIKTYVTIGEPEDGSTPTIDELQEACESKERTVRSFPVK